MGSAKATPSSLQDTMKESSELSLKLCWYMKLYQIFKQMWVGGGEEGIMS